MDLGGEKKVVPNEGPQGGVERETGGPQGGFEEKPESGDGAACEVERRLM